MSKLILVYEKKRSNKEVDGTIEYYYPEDNKNHRERLEWAKSLYPYNLQEDLTVITWCPFIAEAVIKALSLQKDMELVFMIDNEVVSSEQYFGEYASVMRDIQLLNFYI